MTGGERPCRIPRPLRPCYRILAMLGLGLITTGTILADDRSHKPVISSLDRTAALSYSQSALGNATADHHFTNNEGNMISLSGFRGKPLVISFIYTSCHHTCPTLTNHLASVVRIARDALGDESFSVVSIGFDTAVDTPERMHSYARERGIDITGWEFLGTDQTTMDAFGRETGFIYFASAKGFDHLAQTTVLDSGGRVYRQVYGDNFEPPQLVEPLKELVYGQPGEAGVVSALMNNVRLFCTVYDPASGHYRFDYSIFINIGAGIITLGVIAIFLVRAWYKQQKNRTA
ncbi:MAG: hypothetical protein A2W28_08320 [Gammaproteobacteria bacterium RBG_16_51_14]|nr:MAG: hypothetical protein A2W28_08320 [Gammaproteobacteria bacterium RBG_16_51_14]